MACDQTADPTGQSSEDETATHRTSGPTPGCPGPMVELFAGAGTDELAGIAAAMANCCRMFEGACGQPAASAETSEPPTATEAAGSSKKEV